MGDGIALLSGFGMEEVITTVVVDGGQRRSASDGALAAHVFFDEIYKTEDETDEMSDVVG